MPLHNWNQMPAEQLNPLITRRVIHCDSMTIARLEIKKNAIVPEHHHVHEQVATVERGALQFTIGGAQQTVSAGESLVIPSNVPHGVVALEDTIVVDVFSPAREDWIKGDDAYLRK
jgi:quercetin dioxygenase-like cupin family protein